MPQALGTAKTGIYGVVDLFTEQRKYDKDKSKFFIWRERGHASLVHVLITKLKKAEATDPEPKHFEDGYRKFTFASTVSSSSSSGSLNDIHTFATADAQTMQVGDLLMIDAGANAWWTSIDGSGNVTYGTRSATVYTTAEVVEITAVGAPSGGNVNVTVRRGVGGTTPTAPPQITQPTNYYHIGEASEDGSGTRVSFTQSPVVVNNYIEIFKVPYEITDITQAVDIFGENEWQRKARNARKDFARRIERAFLYGRKDRRTGPNQEYIWYTGGMDEWIPADTDHRINLGKAITQTNFNTVLKGVFLYGSEEKFLFGGYGFVTKLANSAADKLRYNDKMSADLGFDVTSFTASGGGVVHIIPDYEMSQTNRDNEAFFADISYLQYMYLRGMDIHIDKGKKGAGLQANDEDKTKHQIKGVIGLKRQFADSHFQLYGLS